MWVHQSQVGVRHPGVHIPQPGQDWGTPWTELDWGIPPGQDRTLVPPGQDCNTPHPETEHQREYFLSDGRYAACVHAGGLSY